MNSFNSKLHNTIPFHRKPHTISKKHGRRGRSITRAQTHTTPSSNNTPHIRTVTPDCTTNNALRVSALLGNCGTAGGTSRRRRAAEGLARGASAVGKYVRKYGQKGHKKQKKLGEKEREQDEAARTHQYEQPAKRQMFGRASWKFVASKMSSRTIPSQFERPCGPVSRRRRDSFQVTTELSTTCFSRILLV
ncbi:hypothetical protein HYPSUDRAFT_865804 [Hypholoma sublateritium FD-334 SS-4]|uniref:Uncharacterized protein n=1 Tax=Hypholoma sublateritium (strain FD-334 SS-4) TaxID=945553 RepID=A0A0D2LJ17_HYPSF|nr:hypothetical protein HYPSUDRAFT_865804 [Hypholoma sublateritium FD-334 SS-4]